jgi:1,4-alpha-glucan branching enzyme
VLKLRSSKTGDVVNVTFVLPLEEHTRAVSVLGDFNGWDPLAHPLKKRSNGTRSVSVEVPAGGHYRFKYLADGGEWFCDPEAAGVELNEYHEANSVLRV